MYKAFLEYIAENKLIKKGDRVLLAVSGGIDSIVMAHLFLRAGISMGIAHCNFTLRGTDSDMDEALVKDFAETHGIQYYSIRFNTKKYASEKGISIQMAARELRYSWFGKLLKKNGYDAVATAHNLNDNIETFIINLVRGTGLTGLSGIKIRRDYVIRPMLFATRKSIEDYCRENSISYREDKSNAEIKYIRNKIRHKVIPLLKQINPSVEQTLNETTGRMKDINEIFTEFIITTGKKIFRISGDSVTADITILNEFNSNSTVLYELFRPYGLDSGTVDDLRNIMKGKTGGRMFTPTHRIIRDRKELLIEKITNEKKDAVIINSPEELENCKLFSAARLKSVKNKFTIPAGRNIACLDFDLISFPLKIRNWQNGDVFYPLGMKHRKKLSDYFIDEKLSVVAKEKIMILESDGKIVWIIGERIDDRFRVTERTSRVLVLRVQSK